MGRTTSHTTRRLNRRALAILLALGVAIVIGLVGIKLVRDRVGGRAYLAQARKLIEQKKPANLTLGYLNRYLELHPDDVDALELKAGLLSDSATSPAQAEEAVQALTKLIARLNSGGARREDARRRLVRAALLLRDRPYIAEEAARKLIEEDHADDAEAHRMHGEALVRLGIDEGNKLRDPGKEKGENNRTRFDEALAEYLAAEKRDPGDVKGAAQLAYFFRERLHDREKAEKVFTRLLEDTRKNPSKHAAALLARAEHYFHVSRDTQLDPDERLQQAKRREKDVREAVEVAPNDPDVRLSAAELALRQKVPDPATARAHLAAIPESQRGTKTYRMLEGMIDLAERKVDDAIQAWRSGLVQTGGTDAELTRQLAIVLLDNGRLGEAEPLIDQYRRLTGGDTPEYHFLDGMYSLRSNHPKEAIEKLESVRRKMKDSDSEGQLYYGLGMAYESVREPAKALDAYRQATSVTPEWSSPWLAMARLQAGKGPEKDLNAAEDTLRRGLALIPDDPRLTTELAAVLWRQEVRKPAAKRDLAKVEKVLEDAQAEARKSSRVSPDLALAEAEFYRGTGRPDDAVQLLKAATSLSPRVSELWLALANLLIDRGKLGEAVETIDRGERTDAAGPQAAFAIVRARILLMKGMPGDARKALKDSLTRVPSGQRSLIWRNLGALYQSQGDITSARATYAEWAQAEPDNPDPRVALFNLALASNDDAAIARAEKGLEEAAGSKAYFWKFARVEDLLRTRPDASADPTRDERRLAEAELLVKEIQDGDPQLPLGYVLEAQVAERRKDVKRAIKAYREALDRGAGTTALAPLSALLVREKLDDELALLREQYPEFATGLERLAVAQAIQTGNKTRAEELADKASKGDPQGLDVRVWQADVLDRLGEPKKAEAKLREAIALKPREAGPYLALLMHQVGQRKTTAAVDTLEQMKTRVVLNQPDLVLAQCYRLIGDLTRADRYYHDATRKWPNDPNVLSQAADFYDQVGRRDDAEATLRSLLRLNPGNTWATRRLALTLASRSGNRAAWEEALRLVGPKARPDDVPDDLYTRALVYAAGPEPEHRRQAIQILKSILDQLPDQGRVNDKLARLLFASNDIAGARVHAAKAVASNTVGPDANLFYAAVLVASHEIDAAEKQLERLKDDPARAMPAAELMAKILAERGKPEAAAALLEKAYASRSNTPGAAELGRSVVGLLASPPINQPEAAERVAREVAKLGANGRCLLANIIADRKPAEAASELEAAAGAGESSAATASALSLAIRYPDNPRWLALAEKLLGTDARSAAPPPDRLEQIALLRHLRREYDKELTAYETIYASKPADYRFLNNMAWTLSEDLKRPEDGLKWANEAIKRVGSQPEILDTRGVILTRLSRLDDALKDLETAAAAGLSDPSLQYHLARAYMKKGNTEKARLHRDLARKAGLTRDRLQPCDRADWDEVMK